MPIAPIGSPSSPTTTTTASPPGTFSAALQAGKLGALAADELEHASRLADQSMRVAMRGGALTNAQLIEVQANLYRYSFDIDLVSRVLDKFSQGVRQTLQSQG